MSDLRNKLIRLAAEHPTLRVPVLNVLRGREAREFQFISNAARTGFSSELLPQIEQWVRAPDQVPVVVEHLKGLLDTALRDKDSLYLLLIRYKSLDASAEKYFGELQMAVDEWATNQGALPALPPPPVPTPAPTPAPVVAPVAPMMPMMVPAPMPMMVPTPVAVPTAPAMVVTTATRK